MGEAQPAQRRSDGPFSPAGTARAAARPLHEAKRLRAMAAVARQLQVWLAHAAGQQGQGRREHVSETALVAHRSGQSHHIKPTCCWLRLLYAQIAPLEQQQQQQQRPAALASSIQRT